MPWPHPRSLLWLTATTVAAAQAQTPPSQGPLPAPVLAALQAADLPPDALAAVAIPLAGAKGSRWQRAWGHQAQRSMQPGSAMKVVTSVVALDRLGPNLRGNTELRSAAPLLPDGTLQGDLVLKGGADPELGIPQFWGLLQELRAAGVQTVAGNLVVDRTLWRPARMDLGLPPFDAAPEFAYNVIPDALQLAGALLPLRLSSSDSSLQARTVAPLPGLRLESRMLLNDSRCAAWDGGWQAPSIRREAAASASAGASSTAPGAIGSTAAETATAATSSTPAEGGPGTATPSTGKPVPGAAPDAAAAERPEAVAQTALTGPSAAPAAGAVAAPTTVIELQGSYPRNCTQRVDLQLIDRQELTERLFAGLWQQLGGRWLGRAVEAAAPPDTRLLARRQSRPWGEVLRTLNKTSDNALSRMLFLNLGVPAMAANPQASTAELAGAEVLRWFGENGINSAGVVMDNGSGLSRSERISPWQLAQVLRAAHQARYAPDLLMSLPVPGVDGTMRNRLKESPAAGWARLKTGTLRNVVALAGYLNDATGQTWAVAMMINHEQASRGRPVLDALVDHIARFGPHVRPGRQTGPKGDGP